MAGESAAASGVEVLSMADLLDILGQAGRSARDIAAIKSGLLRQNAAQNAAPMARGVEEGFIGEGVDMARAGAGALGDAYGAGDGALEKLLAGYHDRMAKARARAAALRAQSPSAFEYGEKLPERVADAAGVLGAAGHLRMPETPRIGPGAAPEFAFARSRGDASAARIPEAAPAPIARAGEPVEYASWLTENKGDARPQVFFHGSKSEFPVEEIQGDEAGLAYFAPESNTSKFYGPNVHQVHIKSENSLDLGRDPYDVTRLVDALYRAGREDLGDLVEKTSTDENGTVLGIYKHLRNPEVVKALQDAGYDSFRFRDDHSENWKPEVVAAPPRQVRPALTYLKKQIAPGGE